MKKNAQPKQRLIEIPVYPKVVVGDCDQNGSQKEENNPIGFAHEGMLYLKEVAICFAIIIGGSVLLGPLCIGHR